MVSKERRQPQRRPQMLQCAYLQTTEPSVLIWGTAADLHWLGTLLAAWSIKPRDSTIGDHRSPERINVEHDEQSQGMCRIDGKLVWMISKSDARRFADLIRVVAENALPGHHYLDCASGRGIEIKVSRGEYQDDFRP